MRRPAKLWRHNKHAQQCRDVRALRPGARRDQHCVLHLTGTHRLPPRTRILRRIGTRRPQARGSARGATTWCALPVTIVGFQAAPTMVTTGRAAPRQCGQPLERHTGITPRPRVARLWHATFSFDPPHDPRAQNNGLLCVYCTVGKYKPSTDSQGLCGAGVTGCVDYTCTDCQDCPKGYYNFECGGLQYNGDTSDTRSSEGSCELCPLGYYKEEVGMGFCTACDTCPDGERRTSCGDINGDDSDPSRASAGQCTQCDAYEGSHPGIRVPGERLKFHYPSFWQRPQRYH